MVDEPEVKRYHTKSGHVIYRLTLEAFHEFWTFVYLVITRPGDNPTYRVLIDTGSGFGRSNTDLEHGLSHIADQEDRFSGLDHLTHIMITHGHIDHFGGLPFLRSRTHAKVGIHELDYRTVTHYDDRLITVSKKLGDYLFQAGLDSQEVASLIKIYRASKLTYEDVSIDFTYEDTGMSLGPFTMLHVPGHCPGHVVIRLDEILFCGDHILPAITPHQAPECLTLNTGLDHYLNSLHKLGTWVDGIQLTLPGHEGEVGLLRNRIQEIESTHQGRFQKVLHFLESPHTVKETAFNLFGEVHGYHGYNRLLALEEAGAHIEYLYLRGLIEITNLNEITSADVPIPIYYSRTIP
ncbi:MAG: MBL fold metallo-hydrolase [Anaerolineales bacterium]